MLLDLQQWLFEILKSFGRLFLNPLLYWSLILLIVAGSKRINRERKQFGFKIFPMFYELKNTWLPAVIVGIFVSIMFIGLEIILPIQLLLLLSIIVILLSVHMKFTMLSASYTIGLTYLLIVLSPYLLEYQNIVDINLFANTPLMSLSLLLGILIMLEAFYLINQHRNKTFPNLVRSDRGLWIGQHHLKKLSIIPFLFLVPSDQLGNLTGLLPYFPYAGETYSIILFPMLIGFDVSVRSKLAVHGAKRIALSLGILGFVVAILSVSSIYVGWFSFLSVIIAIIGREYIILKHKTRESNQTGFFTRHENGLKILSVMPNSPADRLGILTGEMIVKVNGIPIKSVNEFYEALQGSGTNFRLDVIDDLGEVRFAQSALFSGEHYKLGLIFVEEPHDKQGMDLVSKENIN